MAGGKSWFIYALDDGTPFAINMDTSNGQAVGNGAAAANTRTLPRGVKPRRARYKAATGEVRLIPVQSQGGLPGLPATISLPIEGSSAIFSLVGIKGEEEKKSQPNSGLLV
jgi:hypothetical protein